jgi:hypothetical protein
MVIGLVALLVAGVLLVTGHWILAIVAFLVLSFFLTPMAQATL